MRRAEQPGEHSFERSLNRHPGRSRNCFSHGARERGQAVIFVVLALGIFLIGGVGFAVDGANLWFHRQSAQTAADAACTAGAMDLLSNAAGVTPPATTWIPAGDDGSVFHCSGTNSGFPPCSYAKLNGYPGTGSNDVQVTFPTLSIAAACPTAPPFSLTACAADDVAATPYMRVDVLDNVGTTFMRLLGAGPTTSVPAKAVCALSNVLSPLPILVLNPNAAGGGAANTFATNNGATLTVLGGGEKSIQVNSISSDSTSDLVLGDGTIDLSEANHGNGGDFSVAKLESEPHGKINYGTSGKWVETAGIVSDPFATVSAPPLPSPAPAPTNCPGGVPNCKAYQPGYYPPTTACPIGGTVAICVGGGAGFPPGANEAVFEPGVYYLGGDFVAAGNSCLRSQTTGGDGTGGTMFYLAGAATLEVTTNSGTACPDSDSFPVTTAACPGGTLNLPGVTVLTGNVLLAPCTGPYGDPSGAGTTRGILFFHDRSAQPAIQPVWNSAASFALVGNLYFHYCGSSSAGSGRNCASTAFTDTLSLGSGALSYIAGGMVVDQLSLLERSSITVSLNPNPQYYVLKASLVQ